MRSLKLCAVVLIGLAMMSGCAFYSTVDPQGQRVYKAIPFYNIMPERPAIGDNTGWIMSDNEWYAFPRNQEEVQFYLLRNTPTNGFWQLVIDSTKFDGPGSVAWSGWNSWNTPIPFRVRSSGETGNGRFTIHYDFIDYNNLDRRYSSAFRNKWSTKSLREMEGHLKGRDAQEWASTRDGLREYILRISPSTANVDSLVPTNEKKRNKQTIADLIKLIRKANPTLADAIEPKVRERMFETLVAREFTVQFNFRFLQRVAMQNVNYGW
ncbi:MAG: hypothetical protein V1685_07005 [Parcubacteria group bacterium]